jgi:hypothetical protein
MKGAVVRPLERLISAHASLLDAKRAHASVQREVQAGVVRVTESDAMRGKVHELHLALKQRCAAILEARKEEELAELIARRPQLYRAGSEVAPQKMSVAEGAPPSMTGDRGPLSIMSTPCVPCGSTRTGGIAAVRSVEVRSVEVQPLEDGPRLKVQCQLANGAPVTVSLSRHGAGGVAAVIESPHGAVTASLARERANLLAKLGTLGVSLSRLEVRRGGDSHINEGQQMRRPRWRGGEDDDENSIA